MKKLNVTFAHTKDTTGYLFSLTKCLSAALACGGYEDYAEDIVASSGFAFRMWAAPDLCPSATSIWEFKQQKPWVENGGLRCAYVERLWGEDAVEEERRLQAVAIIRQSIDDGVAAMSWDISGCEWGLITGYDDETQTFSTLKIDGSEGEVPYERLGKLDLPILSVLTVTGKTEKSAACIVAGTKELALRHLQGLEWCDNAKGLAAYDLLISFVTEKLTEDKFWNLEYYLGTYAALKWYAWKFFEKYGETELAELYRTVFTDWKSAFDERGALAEAAHRETIANLLKQAKTCEEKAVALLGK